MPADLLREYESERERISTEPPSAFRDALLRNLDDAIEVMRGQPLPERSHKSRVVAADWLERVADFGQDEVVERMGRDDEYRDPRLARLTPRQIEVMELIADGLSYQDTATRLGLAKSTVATIMLRLRKKKNSIS